MPKFLTSCQTEIYAFILIQPICICLDHFILSLLYKVLQKGKGLNIQQVSHRYLYRMTQSSVLWEFSPQLFVCFLSLHKFLKSDNLQNKRSKFLLRIRSELFFMSSPIIHKHYPHCSHRKIISNFSKGKTIRKTSTLFIIFLELKINKTADRFKTMHGELLYW